MEGGLAWRRAERVFSTGGAALRGRSSLTRRGCRSVGNLGRLPWSLLLEIRSEGLWAAPGLWLNELRRMSSATLCLQVRGAPGSPAKTKADRAIVALVNAGLKLRLCLKLSAGWKEDWRGGALSVCSAPGGRNTWQKQPHAARV